MDHLMISVRHFKLLNGEEIVAYVSEKDKLKGTITIERPYLIKNNIIGGYAFLPWFPFASQKIFKLGRDQIMYHAEIDNDMKQEYVRLATSYMKPRSRPVAMKSEEEVLLELEEELYNDLYEEDKTIH